MPSGMGGWSPSQARMRVDRAYKGVSEASLVLYDDGMCDAPTLEVGEQYLLYTRRDEDGSIPLRGCTRSRHVKHAGEDLRYLDGLQEATPVSRIYGQVKGWQGDAGDRAPLAGATVELAGPDGKVTKKADEKGLYSFEGLTPGKYSVSAIQPGFDMPSNDYGLSADVSARGCSVIDVQLSKHWPGIVAGHLIRFDGSPAPAGVDLQLFRLGDEGQAVPVGDGALTDEQGAYVFRSLRPGKYKVAVHPYGFPKPEAPYRPMYWPAATSEEDAAEIVIGDGPTAREYDFRLPPEVPSTVAHGIVLLPNGQPAGGAEVWILVPREHDPDEPSDLPILDFPTIEDRIQAGADGRFEFRAMEGIDYRLSPAWEGGPQSSTLLPFSFSKAGQLIVLRLDAKMPKDLP